MFLKAMIFAFTLALPVGCGSIQMLRNGTNRGAFHCFLTGFGMNVIDIVMMALYYFGISHIFQIEAIKILLFIIGALVIGNIGLTSIKTAKQKVKIGAENKNENLIKSFVDGIKIALVPSSIIYWVTIYGTFLSETLSNSSIFLTACLGILVGFFLNNIFYMTVSFMINKFANQKVVYFINIFSGTFLLGFACYFIYQLFCLLF